MRSIGALAAISLLFGCGGGGGGSDSPVNRPPVITSPASVSVPENATGSVYQAVVTDPDNNSAVTSRIEGPDAADFTLSASGALSFNASPNFESPADADRDNVYQLVLIASDGIVETRLDLTVTVTNTPDQIALREISGYIQQPVDVAPVPGSSLLFVAERLGQIFLADPAAPGPGTLYLTIPDILTTPTFDERGEYGIVSVVAAPDYATSGFLYVFLINSARQVEVRRYGRASPGAGDPNGEVILTTAGVSGDGQSAGGGLIFGPDGYLYVGIGVWEKPFSTAQNLTSLFGKLLRLDVSRDDFPADASRNYGIPAGNPFAAGGGAPEILAYGLEDPRSLNFDGVNLLIGDAHRAPNAFGPLQEVHLLRPQDAGANFGFPAVSGPGIVAPVITENGTNLNNLGKITAGPVYRGPLAELNGQFILADMVVRRVWTVPAANIVQGTTIPQSGLTDSTSTFFSNVPPGAVRQFRSDANGNLYLVRQPDRSVYRLEFR